MIFVVQEHHAKRLHWDFRLEVGGVLKSWAVPRGPSLDPAERRLAVPVPDHALAHARYEGVIPPGYGAGPVLIWDRGTYSVEGGGSAEEGLRRGRLVVRLRGGILTGLFALVRPAGGRLAGRWLLVKERDESARPGWRTPVLLTPARLRRLRPR
ncbi:MAG: 3'-phosphoesterase, partial [Elusimicrobia bacterium]|nr:3'-phosphoesterase [Elusimicrobiota bacterium]